MHPSIYLRSTLSAVHRGVAFEERSLRLLQEHLSMSLCRVGGKSDGGIDLQGWWWVPFIGGARGHERQRLRVLAQCKAEKKKLGPNYVREMEGVLHRYVSTKYATSTDTAQRADHAEIERPGYSVVALVVSESQFTKATLLRAQSSPVPFFLLYLPPIHEEQPKAKGSEIGAAFWNPALAGENGVLGGEMDVRWEHSTENNDQGRIGLWWRGHRLQPWHPELQEQAE